MPTTLPVRRPLGAEHEAIDAALASMSRRTSAARRSGGMSLPLFLQLRFGLWLIQLRLARLRRRANSQP